MENTMNKIAMWAWGVLGIFCLGGVLFAGAWWHIPTALICFVMFLSFKCECKKDGGGHGKV